ncbi:UNVERIFIED_CONTAM: Retrovirus-related Pol polyprotein from transposon TNT 1-94 [Sesamum calycinum]|uniref:Retrovirus-related Pol polyprotein from transposon TNT 1-94 n=1 Tax=Sesamum calycinum TaxID=2727403 RepID=A0AAW2LSQ7_9LAMI
MAKDCRLPKKNQAHVSEVRSVPIDLEELNLSAMVFEVNLVDNQREWWIDTGATRHICSDKEMLSTYTPINGRKLFMGNSATSNIVGLGNVVLKMTLGKELTLIDVACSRYSKEFSVWITVSQNKDEALEAFKLYKNEVENQLSKTIKAIRSDRGGEYGAPFEEFCSEFGIIHQTTAPYSPQSNGIAERKNQNEPRTINEALSSPEAPFWKKAINSEIKSIMQNHTWELVDLPSGSKPFGCKWILKRKYKADGSIDKYKARDQISKTSDGLTLSQSHYVETILRKFKAYDIPPAKTPVDLNLHLAKNKINKLSRFTNNPSKDHWKGLIRILRYLKYTSNYGLHYTRYPVVLEGYSDANWISDSKNTKPTSGYVFTIGGGAVSWKSSKQTCIARSTMESEFIALDKAREETEWLHNFLEDIPCWTKPVPAIMVHCDSQSAIGRAQSSMYNGKSRHIRRRHNTIRQLISSGIISIDYINSKDNLADPLTKGLSRYQVYCLLRGMGLKPNS